MVRPRPTPLIILSPLHRASRQISMHLEARTLEFGLSPGESHLVAYLRSFGPCSIHELRRVFGHKKSTLTGMLDRLAAAAVITREVHPDDRRSFLIGLTREGERLAKLVRKFCEEFEQGVLKRVNKSQFAGFRAVMEAIADVTGVEVRESSLSESRKGGK